MNFSPDTIIDEIIRLEGGYTDDPKDSGGETNHGITIDVARDNGYTGHIKDMSVNFARSVYLAKYWKPIGGDEVLELSEAVAEEMMDTGVNMGTSRAVRYLQRSLNALNKRGVLYPDIEVDGGVGDNTLSALNAYLHTREEEVLVKMLNCLQGAKYVRLSEKNEKDERFIYGWFKNRIGI